MALQSGSPGRFPAPGPPRSGRAQFGHPAPRAMPSLRDQADAIQTRRRQRVTPLQLAEPLPRDARLARTATQPLVPDAPRVVPKAADAPRIAGDPVIGVPQSSEQKRTVSPSSAP